MRQLGFRWRTGELSYAVQFWATIICVFAVCLAGLVVLAKVMF